MHTPPSRRPRLLFTAPCILLAALIGGCNSPVAPPSPPEGGQTYVLDFADFQDRVSPILTARGCDAGGDCHGGGIRGTYALSPPEEKNLQFDFEQTALQVNGGDPQTSPLLTKPLAEEAGGVPHGHKPFETVQDSHYQTILSWIEAGGYE